MKKILLPLAALLVGTTAGAQDIFALTGKNTPNIVFNDFRPVDFAKGTSGKAVFDVNAVPLVYSEARKMTVTEDKNTFNNAQAPAIATLALDATGSELIYMPMYSTNIYALNLATKKITLIENSVVKTTSCNLNSHFTRMTLGADGNIYAMTNSGSQLIQIVKKNGSYQVFDLGTIKDAASNGNNSIEIMQSGFGGDMVADANGDLYVLSASGNIFRVATKTRTAEFMGKISALPENFSLNGAAVNAEGKVVIASAKALGFYEVDMNDLSAKQISFSENLNIYDLASNMMVNEKRAVSPAFTGVDIYPTFVNEGFLNVKLADKKLKGNVTVEIFNSGGITSLKQTLNAGSRNAEHKIELNGLLSGMYVVTVQDEAGNQVLTKKIIVK